MTTIRNDAIDRVRSRDYEGEEAPASSPGKETRSFVPSAEVDTHAQRLMLSFVVPSGVKPDNDDTAYLAMTPGAEDEARAMARTGHGHVSVVHGSASSIVSAADGSGRTFDLSNPDQIDGFVQTLGVPFEVGVAVSETLWRATPEERDELAGIAKTWAPAERGGHSPSRLVLSGHGIGGIEATGFGTVHLDALASLAVAMPNAAARVEDVFLAACFQGRADRLEKLVAAFPNLKTAHGYTDFSPERDVASVERWEAATRGRAEPRVWLYKGNSWTASGGYATKTLPLDVAKAQLARVDVFDRYFNGDARSVNTHDGPLVTYYRALEAIPKDQLPDGEREQLVVRERQTVRLRFYASIAAGFAVDQGAALRAGYATVGMRVPDFAHLDRKQALAAIADTEKRAAPVADRPEVKELLRLLGAFQRLENDRPGDLRDH
jgi:hypothetical protein